ncbi:hypothetical protein K2173_012214 [Erythroxylum novogranatense]|uniref:Benzyl alcohol O-benzoyltransferase n=1 Tax=Erythroxylum novogranatense TaxID=1862640 RepID=A0AAV8T7Q8_9ROSI|nr:hypothetical protein K2173_012214 [Erythroxylum novogranatense]
MARSPTSLVFKVNRREPELIAPAKATPHEFKDLSDIDDQEGLRFQVPLIQFYHYDPSMQGKDPVKVIREALAKTLVFYYPLAGRLREGPNRKLTVECTGKGIIFIEADADVTLQEFGDVLHPPFPGLEELLFDVPGSSGVLNCPLLLVQVTRLKCGGFIFALRFNHTMCDLSGIIQFLKAVSEMARGEQAPSVPPTWERHVFQARSPPRVTCTHREYEEVVDTKGTIIPLDDMVHRSFFFGPAEITALRGFAPPSLRHYSSAELLTACLWKCRTAAIRPDPDEVTGMALVVNARFRLNRPLPEGFYGNALAFPTAVATADNICCNPLGHALELVRKAKAEVTEEYMQSVADLMVIKGRPLYTVARTYIVSDVTRAGLGDVDFGWGKAVYGGPAKGDVVPIPGYGNFCIPFKSRKGENGIVMPICLPSNAMERFEAELGKMLKASPNNKSVSIASAL